MQNASGISQPSGGEDWGPVAAHERSRDGGCLADAGDDRRVAENLAANLSQQMGRHPDQQGDGGDKEPVLDHGRSVFFTSEPDGGGEETQHRKVLIGG